MKCKILAGLVAAIAALGSPAQANEGFCAQIEEVVAAARETPPFSSFSPPSGMEGRRMLGFLVCGTDSLYGYPRFLCASHTDDRGWSDHVELASWIERCLPQAVRAGEELDEPGASRSGRRPRITIGPTYHGIHIDVGDLRFTVERAAHPRVWNVVLTAFPRDRAGEGRQGIPGPRPRELAGRDTGLLTPARRWHAVPPELDHLRPIIEPALTETLHR